MSQENVEVVRAWLDAWVEWFNSERDRDRLALVASDYMAPTVTYEEDPVWPDAGTYRGLDAVLRRFADYIDLVHIERVEPGEVVDAGELVVAEVRIAMLGADEGEAVEFLWTYTLRVEEVASHTSEPGTTKVKPSKPPGCGNRGCRGRTSRSCGAASMPSTVGTSRRCWKSTTPMWSGTPSASGGARR